ncbi:beta-glucosidase 20-like [Physcomitrium patens]|uniref:beta-glucosidase 20-like n=1 Tax=Physcomitrium patens TaxID=3218 RepID=UPI003CCD908D
MILFFVQLPKAILPQRLDPLVLPCRMSATHSNGTDCVPFQQSMFPANFEFLAATAAYQVKGAAYEDGRKNSIQK